MGLLRRSVPALVCASLLIAGGGAYALASSGGGTITVCVSHNGGSLYKAKKCAKRDKSLSWNRVGSPGPQGGTGPAGMAGMPATKLFAAVRNDGTIDASSAGVQVYHASTGVWQVNFGQDVSHCAALAGNGAVPVYSSSGTSTGRTPGYATASTVSAGRTDSPSGYPTADTVEVETFAGATDSATDTSFDVAVFC
jgi:hypothetical protein